MRAEDISSMVDHSLTYKDTKLRNLPHRLRLKEIIKLLETVDIKGKRYCDVGCGNGYITNIICQKFRISDATGLDHNIEDINLGKERYSNINFQLFNLNTVKNGEEKYSVITCFETLEHVGELTNALENLMNLSCKVKGGG